uniref:Alkylated DNA repair alkB-5-like protein n=1 Tax=Aegilops tauschii TaxID=37682 RepID=N1QQ49_AEGTA
MELVRGQYDADELAIAGEFLTTWLPFLSAGLCPSCVGSLRGRVASLLPPPPPPPPRGLRREVGISSGGCKFVPGLVAVSEMMCFKFSYMTGTKAVVPGVWTMVYGDRTYTEPEKWMRGKGRVTIQFGCCYNYATDRKGNPPGIIRTFVSDPIPELFKVMIKRLVRWRILPTDCVPDSCIVNMYDPGDCIPPHIDSHDFVRPFCTVSFLSECDILFGSSLKIAGPGEFTGSFAIPLPVGSVLVINGNGADVAKHCVPAVPSKRISITFRKMDPAKRPFSFKDDPELLNITPLEAPAAPETSRSSDEGKGKQLGVQTRDPGSRSSRSRKSKGRTTPAGKVGWGGILGDQPPQHPQSPISSVSSDRERDSIGRSREPRYPPSSDRERDSVERPREPRYPRDAPSHGEDLRDRLNRPPHERTPGSGVFFVNNGADSQARGQRMEHRQLQMINRTINDDMDSLSVGSHESSEQPRVSVRTIHNRPRTRINLGW